MANVDSVILTKVHNPRATALDLLESAFAEHAPHVEVHSAENMEEAMDLALDLADSSDLVCATGSIYLAAEALRWAASHGSGNAASEIEGVDH